MPRADAITAECTIYTFKEGLLSPIAHDLKIRVGRFEVEWDDAGTKVEGSFDPSSLRVACALRGGREAPELLTARDRAEIERNIAREVLEAARFPTARFASDSIDRGADRIEIRGRLTLHGRERPITCSIESRSDTWVARYTLHQPDFGIRPYAAMLGTLRIKPDVRVELIVRR